MRWHRIVVLGAVVAAGCGGGEPPTAEQLATHLITTDTYTGDWTDNAPPEVSDGVVPDEFQEMLPRAEMCDDLSDTDRSAMQDVRWMAFRQLDLEVEDSIRPPDDRTGHLVFVQEFLTSGTRSDMERTFGQMRDAMAACLGEIPAGEEGPGLAVEMALPALGDERYGVLGTVEEAGGWAEWRLHSVLVRADDVLVLLVVTDIRADAGPYYSVDDVGRMARTAVELL